MEACTWKQESSTDSCCHPPLFLSGNMNTGVEGLIMISNYFELQDMMYELYVACALKQQIKLQGSVNLDSTAKWKCILVVNIALINKRKCERLQWDSQLEYSVNNKRIVNAPKPPCTLYTAQCIASVWTCQICPRKSSVEELKRVTGEGCGFALKGETPLWIYLGNERTCSGKDLRRTDKTCSLLWQSWALSWESQ